jgi:uncharacterized protein YkwD
VRTFISAIAIAALLSFATEIAVPAPQATAQEAPQLCGEPAPGREMGEFELAMLDHVNSFRASRGLLPLSPVPSLIAAAQAKAAVFEQLQSFMHDDSDRTWEQRLIDCGYPADAVVGEVLGCETDGIDSLVRTWQASLIHEGVLANDLFSAAGIARVRHPDGYHCWVIVFGSAVL